MRDNIDKQELVGHFHTHGGSCCFVAILKGINLSKSKIDDLAEDLYLGGTAHSKARLRKERLN